MSKHMIAVSLATAAVVLIAGQSLALFGGRAPTLISPSSFPLLWPALLGVPSWLVAILWGGIFLAWNPALRRGEVQVPPRTIGLWLATALLSFMYFAVSWRAGLAFEGPPFTHVSFALNVVMFTVCSWLLWRARSTPSFRRSLILQASLFIWLATFAFPYLGEVP